MSQTSSRVRGVARELGLVVALASCSAPAGNRNVTPAFVEHTPETIEVFVTLDTDVDPEAREIVRTEVEGAVTRCGYRVVRIGDARMEVTVEDWGASWGRKPRVIRDAILYDCATSVVLWRGYAHCSLDDDTDDVEGWIDVLWNWAFIEADEALFYETGDVAKTAARELVSSLPVREKRERNGP